MRNQIKTVREKDQNVKCNGRGALNEGRGEQELI